MNTRISGTNIILVPYQEKHVIKFVYKLSLYLMFY